MKTKLSAVLFSVCLAACGGDRESSSESKPLTSYIPQMPVQAPSIDELPTGKPAPVDPVASVSTPAVADGDAKPIPTKFDDALAEGRALASKGDKARAQDMFELAIKLDKRRAEPNIELARLYLGSGDKALAVLSANRGVKLAPNSSIAWNTKGRVELARFAYDDAVVAFTKSVELDRDNVWAWNNLGYTELVMKKYDDAAEHLGEATSKKGATGYMWNNLGTALEQLDRLDEARHAFDEGGKLGSTEAKTSRARLEGVASIAIAKLEKQDQVDVKPGYELNEGQTDEDVKMQEQASGTETGSGSGSGSASDTETH
jgi:tetratricopeptide (TPR) repeat protein